jgi:hypothetical protein
MQDYDYVHSCVKRPNDPFVVTSSRLIDRIIIQHALSKIRSSPHEGAKFTVDLSPETEANPIGGTRLKAFEEARLKLYASNFSMAAIGGGFLIAPMWLMVLHNTIWTTLSTTTVCVLFFGALMSWQLNGPIEVLSATAAYAAVLVVFVGANTGNVGGG